MILRLALLALLLAATAPAAPVRRAYRLTDAQGEQIRELARSDEAEAFFAEAGGGTDDLMAEGLRYYLNELGVPLPKTVTIRWNRVLGECVVAAEDDLHARIGRALSSPGQWQVEIDAALVSIPLADIERLARENEGAAPSGAALRTLWKAKGGRLVASTKLLTRPGLEASIFAGDELTHAGEARALEAGSTAETAKEKGRRETIAIGTELVQRRIGLSVSATPTLQPDLQTMVISLSVERAAATGQRNVAVLAGDGTNPPHAVMAEVPTLRSESTASEVLATDGVPLLQSGLPATDAQGQLYLLLTARVVDAQGLPLPAHDFRGRLLD